MTPLPTATLIPTHLSFQVAPRQVIWMQPFLVRVVLIGEHERGLVNQPIVFAFGGQSIILTTNRSGVAISRVINQQPAGRVQLLATYTGDGLLHGSSSSRAFIQSVKGTATFQGLGPLHGRRGRTIVLRGFLGSMGSPMVSRAGPTGASIDVIMGHLHTRVVTGAGGALAIKLPLTQLAGTYPLRLTFDGDIHWVGNQVTTAFTIDQA